MREWFYTLGHLSMSTDILSGYKMREGCFPGMEWAEARHTVLTAQNTWDRVCNKN